MWEVGLPGQSFLRTQRLCGPTDITMPHVAELNVISPKDYTVKKNRPTQSESLVLWAFFVEADGESTWSNFEQEQGQTASNNRIMAKKSRVMKTRPITGARHQKEFRAAEWPWIRPDKLGLLRQSTFEAIPADYELFESIAWLCMMAWCHWRHKRSHVPFFRRLFDRLLVWISTPVLHHRILRKKIYQIRV